MHINTKGLAIRRLDVDLREWHARRRWARAGIIYLILIGFALVFLSPLIFAVISSLKTNPLEYPPTLLIPQLNPKNWSNASRLGYEGSGDPFFGGMKPGRSLDFTISYFVPGGMEPMDPEVVIPRRRAGAGLGAVIVETYAADYIQVAKTTLISNLPGSHKSQDGSLQIGNIVSYSVEIIYPGDGPFIKRIPIDITVPVGQVYTESTITASRIERLGRVASFDNISPGLLGYVFRNYQRVFFEAKSVTTGRSLFSSWIFNSFLFGFTRIITNLLFSAMAGYALARYKFKGKALIFTFLLMVQMLPSQVTFISNYLVLRDGLWGLSRLFGMPTLLNTMSGLVIGGAGTMIEASKVFLMKQYFENLPRDVEEAARIDGASEWKLYSRIMFPMARPALGAMVILTFQGAWNEFFWSFIILTSPDEIKTLPIGLLSFRNTYGAVGDWGLILAGSMLSAIPVVILFIVFQRYFLEGVSFGGAKG